MSRTIVITGASKGIGRALAEHYLQSGDNVVGCSRGPGSIEHDAYEHQELDINDEKAVVRLVRGVARKHGGIDALINNAGTASMNHVLTTPSSTMRRIFDTNVFGTFVFSREVAKTMIKRKSGRIVNVVTVAVPLRLEGEACYAASKAAVESYTRISARELAPFGITVNAIGPTPVETDLIRAVPKDKIAALLEMQAIERFGTAEDISNVTDFFLSERSDFVTGQVLYLGGVG